MKKFNLYNALKRSALLPVLISGSLTLGLAPFNASFAADSATNNSDQVSGSTRFVTDSTQVALRAGPGYKFKIIRMLRSGTAVQVLEVNPSGWMRVQYKTKNKTYEGWMPGSLLQNQPIAKVKLKQQIEKNNLLESENNQLKQELAELKKRYEETDSTLKTVQQQKLTLDKAYQDLKEKSGNALEISEENKQLKQKLKEADNQLILYKEQLSEAEDTVKRQWFLTGAGVLLLGIILGRLFRLPGKRKKWNTL